MLYQKKNRLNPASIEVKGALPLCFNRERVGLSDCIVQPFQKSSGADVQSGFIWGFACIASGAMRRECTRVRVQVHPLQKGAAKAAPAGSCHCWCSCAPPSCRGHTPFMYSFYLNPTARQKLLSLSRYEPTRSHSVKCIHSPSHWMPLIRAINFPGFKFIIF